MKYIKWIIFAAVFLLFVTVLIILLSNKTFFKTYYSNNDAKVKIPKYSYFIKESTTNLEYPRECCSSNATLISIRSKKFLDNYIKNYIEFLPSCYDESYFYDKKLDVTYSKYVVETHGIYKNIEITFQKGDFCKREHILEENWIDTISNSKVVDSTVNYVELIKLMSQAERVEFNGTLSFDDKYQINYLYNKYGYTFYFVPYSKNVIGIIKGDANESKKYAIFDIKKDAAVYLNSLLK